MDWTPYSDELDDRFEKTRVKISSMKVRLDGLRARRTQMQERFRDEFAEIREIIRKADIEGLDVDGLDGLRMHVEKRKKETTEEERFITTMIAKLQSTQDELEETLEFLHPIHKDVNKHVADKHCRHSGIPPAELGQDEIKSEIGILKRRIEELERAYRFQAAR